MHSWRSCADAVAKWRRSPACGSLPLHPKHKAGQVVKHSCVVPHRDHERSSSEGVCCERLRQALPVLLLFCAQDVVENVVRAQRRLFHCVDHPCWRETMSWPSPGIQRSGGGQGSQLRSRAFQSVGHASQCCRSLAPIRHGRRRHVRAAARLACRGRTVLLLRLLPCAAHAKGAGSV